MSVPFSAKSAQPQNESKPGEILRLANGVVLELVHEKGSFYGVGRVEWGEILLRSSQECLVPQMASPEGLEVVAYRLLHLEATPDLVRIVTRPVFRVMHRMEWMEHSMHSRINTSSWSSEGFSPDGAVLEWLIRPVSEVLDGVPYEGFASKYSYHVPGVAIYQLQEKGSWELGGHAIGNTFIMRGGFDQPVAKMQKGKGYQTGWTLPGIANPNVFQHLPLYAQLQGFTFQHDGRHALITRHNRPSHVRSLFAKETDGDLLLHFNQYCFDLTDRVETPERLVLVAPLPGKKPHQIFNHFLGVRDKIQTDMREHYGLRHDPARPSAHVETWEIAKMENLPDIFRQLDRWGIRRSFLMPLWRSNTTEIIPRFISDRDKFGELGNMCCPLELEIAECYGGWEGLKQALAPARSSGLEVYLWYGSHFSSFSPLAGQIPDLFARDQTGQNQRNNYGHVLFAVNQNSTAYRDYLFDRFRRARDCGIKGVFRDSHFNMAADTFNYLQTPYEVAVRQTVTADQVGFLKGHETISKPMIRSMHDAEVGIQRVFQQELGLLYYVESAGLLGTPMCGTDYDMVRHYEWIFSDMETELNPVKVSAHGDSNYGAYFRGLSVRLFYKPSVEINQWPSSEAVSAWWDRITMPSLLKSYAVVEPMMQSMRLLPDGNGVIWTSEKGSVLFIYKTCNFEVSKDYQLRQVKEGGVLDLHRHAGKNLQAFSIYTLALEHSADSGLEPFPQDFSDETCLALSAGESSRQPLQT